MCFLRKQQFQRLQESHSMQTCKCENKSPAQWLVCCPWSWELQALILSRIWTRLMGPILLEHMDNSRDCSQVEKTPWSFQTAIVWTFQGNFLQSNFSMPCGLNFHLGFLCVHPNTSPCCKAAGEEDQALLSKSAL